jgi:hypothetical protein
VSGKLIERWLHTLYSLTDACVSPHLAKGFQASVLNHSGQRWHPERAEIKTGTFPETHLLAGL